MPVHPAAHLKQAFRRRRTTGAGLERENHRPRLSAQAQFAMQGAAFLHQRIAEPPGLETDFGKAFDGEEGVGAREPLHPAWPLELQAARIDTYLHLPTRLRRALQFALYLAEASAGFRQQPRMRPELRDRRRAVDRPDLRRHRRRRLRRGQRGAGAEQQAEHEALPPAHRIKATRRRRAARSPVRAPRPQAIAVRRCCRPACRGNRRTGRNS